MWEQIPMCRLEKDSKRKKSKSRDRLLHLLGSLQDWVEVHRIQFEGEWAELDRSKTGDERGCLIGCEMPHRRPY